MFGCIAAGRLVQTNLQQVDVNKYVFELSDAQTINHLVVFLLGTIPFEPGFAATVHLLWPNKEWQFLGIVSNEKPSAIFRLKTMTTMNEALPLGNATLGISVEPLEVVMQQQQAQQLQLVVKSNNNHLNQAGYVAQKILENLYNYVTSFMQDSNEGVLPLKAFQTWYDNLGRKLANDPTYLSGKDTMP
ncbi:hypothetical protein DFQ28_006139 [Apophysomyces sp. BC1034]|nr:hypothetical protein DFQ30_006149 [Apophysomyces sp. BC1015]KAG0177257.1 hypothetical protein DFQ29_005056 [Apophysomyces sp. BC1021]KAG0187550.1 hypothetical protein DFQ28_006139 [Apophysomyces sp. BC1034]